MATRPAGCNAARCTPTSPAPSQRKHAATPSLSSPERQNRCFQATEATMTSIQPELWVENAREALAFYAARL
jgi:hypothetical protein